MTATSSMLGVRVAGTGSFLPKNVVTNEDLSKVIDTNDEWIRSRTGISERRWGGPEEASSDFGREAARVAMEAAAIEPADVDLLICCTLTPDQPMPTNAALIQRDLELPNAGGFDLNAACAGFVYGFSTAANFVRVGESKCALVIGSEKMSSVTSPTDRSTRVIFGDGAGAVILKPDPERQSDQLASLRGLRGNKEVLNIMCGGSRRPSTTERLANGEQFVKMNGRETFKFAVKTFASLIKDTCAKGGVAPQDLKCVVPHQVNRRIIESACDRAGVSLDDCVLNIDRVGNTSAASVPIALDEAARSGRIERGDLILMVAFGGGLSWASSLVRW
jgi:3-oxoacyl-[acyl-carrier-protein] synthase-3